MPTTPDLFGIRVLFIGNSYTSRNHLPQLLTRLAAAADTPTRVETGMIVAGGASLRRHWNAGAALKIAASRWNYVVLQEQSTLPLKNAARYHDNVRLFDAEIARHGAKTALYLTWSREQSPDTQTDIDRAVGDIATELHARVVPVGPAWHAALAECRDLRLYTDDGSHPTAVGSYLAACVFHVSLFGEVPREFSVSDSLRIGRDAAARLQAIALQFRARP